MDEGSSCGVGRQRGTQQASIAAQSWIKRHRAWPRPGTPEMLDCRELDTQAVDALIRLADVHGSQAAATQAAIMLTRKNRHVREALLDLRQLQQQLASVQEKHQFSEPDTEVDEEEADCCRQRCRLQRNASEAQMSESAERKTPQAKRKQLESEHNAETPGRPRTKVRKTNSHEAGQSH